MGKNRAVKKKLFLKCGTVSMFDLKPYSKEKLQLHHLIKYCESHHTIIEESALVDEENHRWLHSLELVDPYLYYLYNEMVWVNKLNYEEKVKRK